MCGADDEGVKEYISANHPEAVYYDTHSNDEFVILMELVGPLNCRYPIYNWWDSAYQYCPRCDSIFEGFTQSMLWGGPCSGYIRSCDKEGVEGYDKEICAQEQNYQCGCDCKELID